MNSLAAFTYVPPFRGRAIRMIRRDVPFDELEIDFAELEGRKAAEYEKLNRVVRFRPERRRAASRRFCAISARTNAGACGHCDNCRHDSRKPGGQAARRQRATAAARRRRADEVC